MSLQDKITAIMAKPGQDPVSKDDVPWWMKFGGRGFGTIGSFLCIFLGVWNCFGIIAMNAMALVAGMWMVVIGFLVMCCEAPCCCMFIDQVQRISDLVDRRPYWNRALAYVAMAIPPVIMDTCATTIFGGALIFITGVIYGMMALGRKASAEEMRQAAAAETGQQQQNSRPNSSMHSNLVANAQPISFTGAPVFDSNV